LNYPFKKLLFFVTLFIWGLLFSSDQKSLESLLNNLQVQANDVKLIEKVTQTELNDIKIWDGANGIRVVLYPSREIKFKYNLLKQKQNDMVYLDLEGITNTSLKPPSSETNSFLKRVRFGQKTDHLRIVLDTDSIKKYNVSVMEQPWRIIVDLYGYNKKSISKKSKQRVKTAKKDLKKTPFLIVVDPGHGGKDPGAIKSGHYEKNVVFRLAQILKKRSENMDDIKVVLTRGKDKFLSLEERAVIANKKNGDLFISLHANSHKSKSASGVEIYHLDNRKSEYTDRLALVENRLTKKYSLLNNILVDMTMSYYIKDSISFTKSIGRQMKKGLKPFNTRIRDYRKGALFYVLVGARMPSMLIEVGFLSNRKERKLLTSTKYLEAMSDSILKAVQKVKNSRKLVKNIERKK